MFKDRLAVELRRSGMSQTELAARVGVSKGSVSVWLRGSEPRRPQYDRLLDVLPGLRDNREPESAEAAS